MISKEKLTKFYNKCTGILPSHLISLDCSRLTVLFFGIGGQAILREKFENVAKDMIDFVYAHQIHPSTVYGNTRCGFRGSMFIGCPIQIDEIISHIESSILPYDSSHVTMTYVALNTLLILGDDLSRVNRKAVVDGILYLQNQADDNKLITGSIFCSEFDARFVFSAIACLYILDSMDKLDIVRFVQFLSDSITYEGGFSQLPGLEAHAGATFCAIASLKLMNKLDTLLPVNSKQRSKLINWLLHRQCHGFNGRIGKDDDTCYTFWVGACLRMLDVEHCINQVELLNFVCSNYDSNIGGFMKSQDTGYPDPLHSFLTISGLSTLFRGQLDFKQAHLFDIPITELSLGDVENKSHCKDVTDLMEIIFGSSLDSSTHSTWEGIDFVVPHLNLPETAFLHLKQLHKQWRKTDQIS